MGSVQNKRFFKTCIDLLKNWWSSYFEAASQIFVSSVVVLSLIYKVLDFISKSPSTTIKCHLHLARVSKVSSDLYVNLSEAN